MRKEAIYGMFKARPKHSGLWCLFTKTNGEQHHAVLQQPLLSIKLDRIAAVVPVVGGEPKVVMLNGEEYESVVVLGTVGSGRWH